MPPGRLRSPPAAAWSTASRYAGVRSPTLCRRLLGVLAGGQPGVERESGPCPSRGADRRRPSGQTRAGLSRGSWRHWHRREPPPPQRADGSGLRLGLGAGSKAWSTSPIQLHGATPSFRRHRIALALLERGVDAAIAFSAPLLEPEDLYAQLARQKLHRLVTQRASSERPHASTQEARHRGGHRWRQVSQRACRLKLAFWGKRGRAKLARIYQQAHQQQLSSRKLCRVMRPPWTLRSKPILCPRMDCSKKGRFPAK